MFRSLLAVAPPLFIAIIGVLLIPFNLFFACLFFVFGLADTMGRYSDYKYLSGHKYLPIRVADYYGRSFCGRWMVCFAQPYVSSGNYICSTPAYYRSKGYRPWHLFPEGFPGVLLKPAFWRNLSKGQRRV